MNRPRMGMTAVAVLILVAALALPAHAQPAGKPAADNEARVHRMEIWNGPFQSVYFYSQGTSTGDETALRDLERSGNDLALLNQVQSLRRLYLLNQRVLAQRQNEVISSWAGDYALGYGSFPYGAPSPYALSAPNGPAGGNIAEGALGGEFAHGLAQLIAPEAMTNALRSYDQAVARVADSKLGSKIGLVKTGERTIGPAVTLHLKKGNEKISGNLVSEDKDWITVETAKEEISVRKADVDRIVRTKSDVKPASR